MVFMRVPCRCMYGFQDFTRTPMIMRAVDFSRGFAV